jgi:tellurite resistance protein TehA-like permease
MLHGMPFALTWWSLTFPVGTFVTGTAQLAVHTHLLAFKAAAALAYAGLLSTWILVAIRTARGSLRGNLLTVAPSTAPVKASKQSVM